MGRQHLPQLPVLCARIKNKGPCAAQRFVQCGAQRIGCRLTVAVHQFAVEFRDLLPAGGGVIQPDGQQIQLSPCQRQLLSPLRKLLSKPDRQRYVPVPIVRLGRVDSHAASAAIPELTAHPNHVLYPLPAGQHGKVAPQQSADFRNAHTGKCLRQQYRRMKLIRVQRRQHGVERLRRVAAGGIGPLQGQSLRACLACIALQCIGRDVIPQANQVVQCQAQQIELLPRRGRVLVPRLPVLIMPGVLCRCLAHLVPQPFQDIAMQACWVDAAAQLRQLQHPGAVGGAGIFRYRRARNSQNILGVGGNQPSKIFALQCFGLFFHQAAGL